MLFFLYLTYLCWRVSRVFKAIKHRSWGKGRRQKMGGGVKMCKNRNRPSSGYVLIKNYQRKGNFKTWLYQVGLSEYTTEDGSSFYVDHASATRNKHCLLDSSKWLIVNEVVIFMLKSVTLIYRWCDDLLKISPTDFRGLSNLQKLNSKQLPLSKCISHL